MGTERGQGPHANPPFFLGRVASEPRKSRGLAWASSPLLFPLLSPLSERKERGERRGDRGRMLILRFSWVGWPVSLAKAEN